MFNTVASTRSIHRGSDSGAMLLQPRVMHGRRFRVSRIETVCLRMGVSVEPEMLGPNRLKMSVKVTGQTTKKLEDEGIKELGGSIGFPQFQKGKKNKPLPRAMIMNAFGAQKVQRYIVEQLVMNTVCDHAAESALRVRSDLTAEMAVQDLSDVVTSFKAGDDLEFTAEIDVVSADYRP